MAYYASGFPLLFLRLAYGLIFTKSVRHWLRVTSARAPTLDDVAAVDNDDSRYAVADFSTTAPALHLGEFYSQSKSGLELILAVAQQGGL